MKTPSGSEEKGSRTISSLSRAGESPRPTSGLKLVAIMLCMELLWGLHYVVSKYALREFDPLVLATLRVFAAAAILGLLCQFSDRGEGGQVLRRSRWPLFLQLGLFGITLNQLFFILGLARTLPSHSALILSTSPLFVIVLARLKGMERLAGFRAFGMLISVFGVVALNLKSGFHLETRYLMGDGITVLCVLAFSYYTIIGKQVSKESGLLRTTFATYLGGLVFMVPVGFWGWKRQDWGNVHWDGLSAFGYMVLGGSIAAYLMFYYALRHTDASRVAAYGYIQPILAAGFSIGFMGEHLTWSLTAGMLTVLTGVLVAERGRAVFDWLF